VIPGKKYAPEDIVRLAARRWLLLLLPIVVIGAATAAVSSWLPNRYRSETLILVIPQRVPEEYVRPTVTTRINDRLQAITQEILSRTRLERIIQDFNLYAEERRTGIMEDVVEQMRRDIGVQVVKGDAFRVNYTANDPRTAMKVTERLASLFIDASLRDREVLAENTNQFLEAQLDDARRQLVEHEKKLEIYRKKYDGELPSQVNTNLQVIQSAQTQMQAVSDSLNRDRDQKVLTERQIADLAPVLVDPAAPTSNSDASDAVPAGSPRQQLESAKATLKILELRLTPAHPDIVRVKRLIADLEAKVAAEAADPSAAARPLSASERARKNRIDELSAQRDNLDRDIAAKQQQMKHLQGVIAEYQARVAVAPTRETELTELTRDYETLQKSYESLLAKSQDSKVAVNLERRQIGEQFKVLDPARMPEKPYSPNRILINSAGAIGGLLFGVALVALLEYRDQTLKSDGDVALALSLPVLASVPLMITTAERATAKRKRLAVSLATIVFVLGAAAAVVWKLHLWRPGF